MEGQTINTKSKLKISETHIKAAIRDYLQLNKWYVINIFQTLGCHPGIADLYAIKNGHGFWIEVKKPGGRQSKGQKDFQAEIEEHGGLYFIASSVEDMQNIIKNSETGQEIRNNIELKIKQAGFKDYRIDEEAGRAVIFFPGLLTHETPNQTYERRKKQYQEKNK